MVKKGRVFNVMQYEYNPKTGESLNFDEENIKRCVAHKTIKQYAYIRHNRDTVTQYDIDNEEYLQEDLGKMKEPHWHMVFRTDRAESVDVIAKWLGIPPNFVNVPKGRGAFWDCIGYLTHASVDEEQGKFVYPASDVIANFDWQTDLAAWKKKSRPRGEIVDYLRQEILFNGMRLMDVYTEYPSIYAQHCEKFEKLRSIWIRDHAPLPEYRVNFYIYGDAGYGKDTMARAIARSYVKEKNLHYYDDAYFEVGTSKVTFEGYDGQPIIVWSDFRAQTLIDSLDGYENVLNVFDIIPKESLVHKKFGSIKLINAINIITSTQPYAEFLRELIPPSDPSPMQANRRFPIIIPIHEHDFRIMINAGYLDKLHYRDYVTWGHIQGSFAQLARNLDARPDMQRIIEEKAIEPVQEARRLVEQKIKNDPYAGMTDEEILELPEWKNFGKPVEPPF